jgi:hypothetical protein
MFRRPAIHLQGASRSPKMENDDGPGPKGPYPPPHGPGPMGGHMPMEDWHRHHNYPSGPVCKGNVIGAGQQFIAWSMPAAISRFNIEYWPC